MRERAVLFAYKKTPHGVCNGVELGVGAIVAYCHRAVVLTHQNAHTYDARTYGAKRGKGMVFSDLYIVQHFGLT